MSLLLLAVCILVLSGVAALCAGGSARLATVIAVCGAVAGAVAGIVPAVQVLAGGALRPLHLAWGLPLGSFSVEIDALSAFFILPILVISAIAAIYGSEYMRPWWGKKSIGASWFFYNVLTASMLLVVVAKNGMLFLLAWEAMSLSSFFLVTFESERASSRQAGWTYLIATHLGSAFLLVMFVLLGQNAGSLDFDTFSAGAAPAGVLFVMAVVGFGTKAGFIPLHVWLPEAHPAAPSHVSAVMSGVMIKTGIYGLVRTFTFLGPPPLWWGWLLIGIGVLSGVLGVLFALAQHDLKRLLAYHSVENIGIITLGLGIGMVGLSCGSNLLAALGFGGGLLHVINHAMFKGLLFLGAGSVAHATGTREIDHLGGLIKPMRWTAFSFLAGSVAICGLPPLNGFISEFLIYFAAFKGVTSQPGGIAAAGLVVIAALALIGGLAMACFTKAFGIVFLGEPRTEHAQHAHEAGPAMRFSMLALAVACFGIGLAAPLIVPLLAPVISVVAPTAGAQLADGLASAVRPLVFIVGVGFGVLVLAVLLALLRRRLLAKRPVTEAGTWDCGYAAPTARMQYTASSFAQPLTALFSGILRTRQSFTPPEGPFPREREMATKTPDVFREGLFRPLYDLLVGLSARLRWVQHGRIQLYVLYIAATILILLVWKL